MGTGIVEVLALASATLALTIAAVVAYLLGHKVVAFTFNGTCPLLVLSLAGLDIMQKGIANSRISADAILFYVAPLCLAFVASVIGIRLRSLNAVLFWPTWTVNILSSAAFFYLAYVFQNWHW